MDFIISALASAAGSLGLEGVQRGYSRLKELLRSKFGAQSELVEAVRQLERHPDSAARKDVLAEEPAKVGAEKDEEIIKAAEALRQRGRSQVDARGAQIGVMGDHAEVKGGIHFSGK
ncbi:MAG: hypothetical protein D3914_08975 [Candidatus Electrothrix sp. LOE2]|nr:hypothetical protein [Candidatus Electrothrix sp. LOE2]